MNASPLLQHRRTITTRLGDVAVHDRGTGPAVVFIHGVFMNGLLWRNVAAAVCDVRRCIAIDMPAHGGTPSSPDWDLSLRGQASVIEAVCDALDLDELDIVGNDTGGAVTQVFVATTSRRIRSLTLTNCDAHDNVPPAAFLPAVELAARGELSAFVRELTADLELARSDAGLGLGYADPKAVPDDVVRAFLEPLVETDARAAEFDRYCCSVNADQLLAVEPDLARLDAPTLIVWGDADVFFEPHWAYWLRELLPGAGPVVEIAGGKLFFPDERAGDLVPHLLEHWRAAGTA